jgi:hypothetical protein
MTGRCARDPKPPTVAWSTVPVFVSNERLLVTNDAEAGAIAVSRPAISGSRSKAPLAQNAARPANLSLETPMNDLGR